MHDAGRAGEAAEMLEPAIAVTIDTAVTGPETDRKLAVGQQRSHGTADDRCVYGLRTLYKVLMGRA